MEQSKSNAPKAFSRFLSLIRAINQGNAIISAYGTNFEYIGEHPYDYNSLRTAITQAIIYDNECSCALNADCTIQASFIQSDRSDFIPITGLKMGCILL